jgi:hypothetical protein
VGILNYSYYSSRLSNQEKENILIGVFNSSLDFYRILVTSNSLQESIDYSTIRLVIYKD